MKSAMSQPMRRLLTLLVALVFVALPFVAYPLFLIKALCFVLAACAFNLLLGGVGLLSLGHATFFGGASYLCGYLMVGAGWPPAAAIACAVAATALVGMAFGWLSVQRQGMSFSMVTLALAQFAYFAFSQSKFTGGDDGLQGVPRGILLGLDLNSDLTLYYVVLVVVGTCLALLHRVNTSPFGLSMQLVKGNENRALSLGYDVRFIKWQVFVLSSTMTAVAGALKVNAVQFASLGDMHFEMSGEILMMAVIGGAGSLTGAAVGALALAALHEYFSGLGGWIQAIQGAVFAVVVLFFPGGLYGILRSIGAALWRRLSPAPTLRGDAIRRLL